MQGMIIKSAPEFCKLVAVLTNSVTGLTELPKIAPVRSVFLDCYQLLS